MEEAKAAAEDKRKRHSMPQTVSSSSSPAAPWQADLGFNEEFLALHRNSPEQVPDQIGLPDDTNALLFLGGIGVVEPVDFSRFGTIIKVTPDHFGLGKYGDYHSVHRVQPDATIIEVPVGDVRESFATFMENSGRVAEAINRGLKAGQHVLVHCTSGMSQSAANLIMYLGDQYPDRTYEDIRAFVQVRRPMAAGISAHDKYLKNFHDQVKHYHERE